MPNAGASGVNGVVQDNDCSSQTCMFSLLATVFVTTQLFTSPLVCLGLLPQFSILTLSLESAGVSWMLQFSAARPCVAATQWTILCTPSGHKNIKCPDGRLGSIKRPGQVWAKVSVVVSALRASTPTSTFAHT